MQEHDAQDLMAHIRWPSTVQCPNCAHDSAYRLNIPSIQRCRYKCSKCRRQFSVTKGTILEGVRVPLSRWVATVKWACHSDSPCKRSCDLCLCAGIGNRAADNAMTRMMYAQRREPLRSLILANNSKKAKIENELDKQLCLQGLNWQHVLTALLRTPPPNG